MYDDDFTNTITVVGSYLYSLLLSLCHETRAVARTHTHTHTHQQCYMCDDSHLQTKNNLTFFPNVF